MNKTLKISAVFIVFILLVVVILFFMKQNTKGDKLFDTMKGSIETIVKNTVATGKVNPKEEIEIKPQVTGIIKDILVEEGDFVNKGDIIARIRVVPDAQKLAQANNQVELATFRAQNAKFLYDRNTELLESKAISLQNYQNTQLEYQQAKQNLSQAKRDYEIILKGFAKGAGNQDNTIIKAQISGTVLEIPLREGDQVIQANTFNPGSTIVSIADMSQMIFEGTVDESEVDKLKEGEAINVSLGALNEKKFPAKLTFIAPKGIENNGAVQFKIKAEVTLDSISNVRAGYSANALIELDRVENVFSINEGLLQFEEDTGLPYVDVKTSEDLFIKKNLVLGLSDGVFVEVKSGLDSSDDIKIWNPLRERMQEFPENKKSSMKSSKR